MKTILYRLTVLFTLCLLPSAVYPAQQASLGAMRYNLAVSFDIAASKVSGTAEIGASAGRKSLIASKDFVVSMDTYNGIEIVAYILPEEAHFARTFIEHTKRYLKTYEKLLGKYPYKRLSIVEHFEQAGYSMPTYIFLGREDFRLPITFYSKGKKTTRIFTLDKERDRFSVILPEIPDEIVLDEDYDLFRRLSAEEDPPTLERLASDENKIVVMPSRRKGMYNEIVDVFNEKGKDIELAYMKSGIAPRKLYSEDDRKRGIRFRIKNGDRKKRFFSKEMTALNDEAIKDSSLVVLGIDNPVIEKLFGKTESAKDSAILLRVDIKKNPLNPEKVVAIINVTRRQKTSDAFNEIFEYPFYSSYYLKDGRIIKELKETPRGIRIKPDYRAIK